MRTKIVGKNLADNLTALNRQEPIKIVLCMLC